MRHPFQVCLLAFGILALVALSAFAPRAAEAAPVDVMWRDGLFFEAPTDHGDVVIRLGGSVHFDSGWGFSDLDDDASSHAHEPRDEYRIRRARVDLRGSFFDSAEFRLQFDFAAGAFADAYVGLHLGPGMLTVGQKRAHFSMQNMVGAHDSPMMEASWVAQLFALGRLLGLGYEMNLADDMIGLAFGFHRLTTPNAPFTPNQNIWALGSRFWASLMNDDGDSDLHVGLSFTHRILHEGGLAYNTRGAVRTAPPAAFVIQRSTAPLDSATLIGVEAAFTTGGLRTMLEFAGDITNPTADGMDGDFLFALSATVGYLLNGDSHNYDAGDGVLRNPNVDEPFGSDSAGLFEVLMHFDFGDLSDNLDDTPGLSGVQVGLGFNWYLNNNMRAMFNLALVSVSDDGTYFLMGTRIQVNF